MQKVKALFKKLIALLISNDVAWSIWDATIIRPVEYAIWQRKLLVAKRYDSIFQDALIHSLADLKVKNGPFKGMAYPRTKAIGSSLTPKLLGSYEQELHPIIERICFDDFTEIVDIGCAEGYYAVGLAMRIPHVKVFAFDTDVDAIELCQEMAEINGVHGSIAIGFCCDGQTLRSIPFTEKVLIISDCEGYERHLFTEDIVPFLSSHELLIEVHDFIYPSISSTLTKRFQPTHNITIIESIDDASKAREYEYEQLERYNLNERRMLVAENRPETMQWFYMTPRTE